MSPNLIIWLFFGIITLLFFIPCIVNCFKRNWLQALIRFLVFAISVVASIILAKMLVKFSLEKGYLKGEGYLQNVFDYLVGGSVGGTMSLSFANAILTPILFFVLFIITDLVLSIVYLIFSRTLLKKAGKGGFVGRLATIILTLALFAGTVSAFFLPFPFYSEAASYAYSTEGISENDLPAKESVLPYLNEVDENPIAKVTKIVTTPAVNILTQIKAEEETAYALPLLKDALSLVSEVMPKMQSLDAETCAQLSEEVKEIPYLDRMLGAILQDAAPVWEKNEKFLDFIDPILDPTSTEGLLAYPILEKNELLSDTLRELATLLKMSDGLNALSSPTAESVAALAQTVKADPKTDEMLGSLLKDAVASWKEGKPYLGIDPIAEPDSEIAKIVYPLIEENDLLSETLEELQPLLALYEMRDSFENPTSASMKELADTVKKDPKTDEMLGSLLKEAIASWKNGEPYMGVDPIFEADSAMAKVAYPILEKNDLLSDSLYEVSYALEIAETFSASDEEKAAQQEQAKEEVGNAVEEVTGEKTVSAEKEKLYYDIYSYAKIVSNPITATILKSAYDENAIKEMGATEEQAEEISTIVNTIIDNVVSINRDSSKTEEEKNADLMKESVIIGELISYAENPDSVDIETVESAIEQSSLVDEETKAKILALLNGEIA